MSRLKSIVFALGTVFCALSLGFVIQEGSVSEPARPLNVADIVPTSSLAPVEPSSDAITEDAPPVVEAGLETPVDETIQAPEADPLAIPASLAAAVRIETLPPKADRLAPPKLAATQPPAAAEAPAPLTTVAAVDATDTGCDITMTATPAAAAMVDLSLTASCLPEARVTLHHSGLMITEMTDATGTLTTSLPALAETAVFIAAFENGEGAVAQTSVSSLPFYDRVAVQWQGDLRVELHAREFGAAYWTEGHIWHENRGAPENAARGESGFLLQLGRPELADAFLAEVYSFPAGTAQREGMIDLTVEAEIFEGNCGRNIESQTLELRDGASLRTQDLTVAVPDCDAAGDFLLLKNMLENLKIARN